VTNDKLLKFSSPDSQRIANDVQFYQTLHCRPTSFASFVRQKFGASSCTFLVQDS